MNILFLTDEHEDYLADGVLHGLKTVKSIKVTDFPRKDILYKSFNRMQQGYAVRGGGFTLYGKLSDETWEIDRSHIRQKLENKYFDVVIIANIWRQWGLILQWQELLMKQSKLVILDGDDDARVYPFTGSKIRKFGILPFPYRLLTKKSTYLFKREKSRIDILSETFMPSISLSFSIPEIWVSDKKFKKTQMFPKHIVDASIATKLRRSTSYQFIDEIEYHSDLAASRFGITTRRGGWDCLRHYEIAANQAIICFKDLKKKSRACAPFGLIHGDNCLSYSSFEDLMNQINTLSKKEEKMLRLRSLQWAKASTTRKRAEEVIKLIGIT